MNIIVRPHGSQHCYCRPDTTWERENKDFYVPEGIEEMKWAPIVFVRISKAGKCIGRKFASRYYDAFNFGILLYCMQSGDSGQIAFTSCCDHTSLLPSPLYNTVVMENEDNTFEVWHNDTEIFRHTVGKLTDTIEETVCLASRMTSLRIGDYVAVELADIAKLASSDEGCSSIKADFCGNESLNLKLVF